MAGLYGHRWVSSYGHKPDSIAAREWALVIQDLTPEQVAAGLDACRRSGEDWPPTAPAFRARCFGIPSFEQVMADLMTRKMAFTLMVWETIDPYALSLASQRDAERMVRNAYDYAAARRLDGAPLPELPVGVIQHEKPVFKPASEEARQKARDAVNAALGRSHTQESGTNPHE